MSSLYEKLKQVSNTKTSSELANFNHIWFNHFDICLDAMPVNHGVPPAYSAFFVCEGN